MLSESGNPMQQRVETRWKNSSGRLPLTLHNIEAAGLAQFFGSTGISQPCVVSS